MDAVLLEQVCKSFGEVRAVDGLSVRVPAASIYGFLGPNGAGKTTTIRMIMNIIRPDSGRIAIFGDGANTGDRDRIGYMPEERGLYRKMTVSKVLGYFGAIKGMSKGRIAEKAPQWLERVGLGGWAGKKVEDLSRGMHQKLQFAVTVVNEPDLLVLDEPFSGLDPVNLDLLKEIILEMRDEGRTVIFSTHVMHEAERLCDFILLINKGRAVLDGGLDEIRSRQKGHAVSIEAEGDTGFIAALPMVAGVKREGRRLEIALSEGGDTQELLKALVGRVRIRAFEMKVPSLHEIFVKLVGADNAQDP
ncbi:MAG TPA: ATP-binding cassette domain-containing protein [Sedimentisphaerales bacterium]|nr:ATP-binding cassette domain-containing protein [Sedimentisphaerales bacterium]